MIDAFQEIANFQQLFIALSLEIFKIILKAKF